MAKKTYDNSLDGEEISGLFIDDENDVEEPEVEETEEEEETEETEEEKEEEETEDEDSEDGGEASEEEEKKETPPKEVDKDNKYNDSVPWIKKRLSRAKNSYEKEFIDYAGSASDGIEVSKDDIPGAMRLWNLLKNNETLNLNVTSAIEQALKSGKAKQLHEISGVTKDMVRENKLAVREATLDLRGADKVYKKYETNILQWAEEEGLSIKTATDVKRVYREWKGEHAQQLIAAAEKVGRTKAQTIKTKKSNASLSGGKSTASSSKPMDYKNASDEDILKRENLSIFTED